MVNVSIPTPDTSILKECLKGVTTTQTKIIFDGEAVIQYLYELLNDEDGTLVINIPNDVDAAKAAGMTHQRFVRALLYLKGKGYIEGDTSYSPASHGGIKRCIIITSNGIDYVETKLI